MEVASREVFLHPEAVEQQGPLWIKARKILGRIERKRFLINASCYLFF
jgi:hypothetical protein